MSENERISLVIKSLGIKQGEFGKKIGLSPAMMSHVLKSQKGVRAELLKDICEAYPDLNPEWLLLGKGEMWRDASNGNQTVKFKGRDKNRINISQGDQVLGNDGSPDVALLEEKIRLLEQMIKEKDSRIEDKEELIQMYKKMLKK